MWDNCALAIINSDYEIEKLLSYWEASLVYNHKNRRRETKRELVQMFNVLHESTPRVIQAHQGALADVEEHLKARGLPYRIQDQREAFPDPRLDLMNGFRLNQRQLATDLLTARQSGCLEAPTRYGKTIMLINVLRAFPGLRTGVTAPGEDLVRQLHEAISQALPQREVVLMPYKKKYPGNEITVVSMDSLHKVPADWFDLLLVDEPHAAVTNSRIQEIAKFCGARKYAFGATLEGRYDNRDRLIHHLFGPTLAKRTFQEAVAEGAICQIHVIYIKVSFKSFAAHKRDTAYNRLLLRSDAIARLHARICAKIIPQEYQTISFIANEKQADLFMDRMPEGTVLAMAKKMGKKERQEKMQRMASGQVKRCLATKIYAQGVTFSDLRCMINVEGGGDSCSSIQKPGRLAEIRPNKKCGVVFDFLFDCTDFDTNNLSDLPSENAAWSQVIRDSRARQKAYKRKGYEIHDVETLEEAKEVFNQII